METANKTLITVQNTVQAPVEKVWHFWTTAEHITQWNNASPDWHTPYADNDLSVGGKFVYRMEAKDGSFGFDFVGHYNAITEYTLIESTLEDGRKVIVHFSGNDSATTVVETFEAEDTNPVEMQKGGWQAILDNFKKYTEITPML